MCTAYIILNTLPSSSKQQSDVDARFGPFRRIAENQRQSDETTPAASSNTLPRYRSRYLEPPNSKLKTPGSAPHAPNYSKKTDLSFRFQSASGDLWSALSSFHGEYSQGFLQSPCCPRPSIHHRHNLPDIL